MEKFEEAVENCNKALEINIHHKKAYNDKARALAALKKYGEAIQNLDKALELDPSYVKAHLSKSLVFLELKKYEEAMECVEDGLKRDPNNVDYRSYYLSYVIGATICQEQQKYKNALDWYEKAVRINPSDPLVYFKIGLILHLLKRYHEAIRYYDKSLDRDKETCQISINCVPHTYF